MASAGRVEGRCKEPGGCVCLGVLRPLRVLSCGFNKGLRV